MDRDARIAIAGMSTSYTALSVFTNNLRRSSVFSDVRIAGAKAAGGRSSEAVAFSVEVKVPSGVGAASSSDAAPAAPSVPKIPGAM
jgi:Tfp pilus assembly protein PilN